MQEQEYIFKNKASEKAEKVLVIHTAHKSFTKNAVGIP